MGRHVRVLFFFSLFFSFLVYLSSNGLPIKVEGVFFALVLVDLSLDLLALFLTVEVNVDVYWGREAEDILFREKRREKERRSRRCASRKVNEK